METEENNSEQFIKSLKVEGGFNLPSQCFEELEERLKAISFEPVFGRNNINGFVTPEAYFETLETRILKQIHPHSAKVIPFYKKGVVKVMIAIAAALLLVSMLFLYAPHQSPGTAGNISVRHPSEQEIIDHLSSDGYNEDLLCDAGWCNDLNKMNDKANKELENYFMKHGNEDLLLEEF